MIIDLYKKYELTLKLTQEEAWTISTALLNLNSDMAVEKQNPFTNGALQETSNILHDKIVDVLVNAEVDIQK